MNRIISSNIRSECLDLLRFPLAIVVMYIHIWNWIAAIPANEITVGADFLHIIDRFIFVFLKGQSVPIYFFISGYVFFLCRRFDVSTYWRKLKNRVHSLFIPYVVWNVLFLLVVLFLTLPVFSKLNSVEQQPVFTLSSILNTFWDSSKGVFPSVDESGDMFFPQNNPLWFLRDLMYLALLSPIVYIMIVYLRMYALVMLAIVWLLSECNVLAIPFYFPLLGMFFFSIGAYMSIYQRDMIADFSRVRRPTFFVYIVLSVLLLILYQQDSPFITLLKSVNIIVGLFVAYNVAAILLQRNICKVNKFCASSSIFIYLSHAIFARYLYKAITLIFPTTNGYTLFLVSILTLVLSAMLLLCVFYVMKRFTPGLLAVMIGRKQ